MKIDTNIPCPLCKNSGHFFFKNKNRLYYKCDNCFGIFLDKTSFPDKETETLRYKKHNNNSEDPGYKKFVEPIVSAIIKNFSTGHKGLDFGAGPDSAISKMLKNRKFQLAQYDPLFHNFPNLLEKRYDYIACSEVIEHFHNPYKEFTLLKKLLLPGGKLYCMTAVYNEEIDFGKWYYKNDSTHVFFYHKKTFEYIKEEFGFSHLRVDNNLFILSLINTDVLLITPPFSQLNTPYPATVFLKGFLVKEGFSVKQADLSIETIRAIFSKKGLKKIFNVIESQSGMIPSYHAKMLNSKEKYYSLIYEVISFLQGNNESYAKAICAGILPKGNRYKASGTLAKLFNKSNTNAKAKFLATIFIEEIGDLITAYIDSNFGFSRYAEQIGISPRFFGKSVEPNINQDTLITGIMYSLLDKAIKRYAPKTIAFTIPFPGNLLSVLKMSQHIKKNFTKLPIIIGGGWVNTELRQLADPKIFDYIDYICLDFGERPLLQLLKHLINNDSEDTLVRTFVRKKGKVTYLNNKSLPDIEPENNGTPDYSDLHLDKYISAVEMANPMHCLWSNGRWNKLMVAQGCYWHKCAFCDTSLDYINKYITIPAHILCDRIEAIIKQTSHNGFHFVDEAAPPKALRELAMELIKRNIKITWWANIRFESNFTRELCELLAKSGCIAVAGGLEVLSDRLLKKMNKGITIEQAARATHNFSCSGIMVHAYLMYGFPTQTAQETVNSLEIVRQFFENKLIQSAYWHHFAMTVHSPIGKYPEKYNVKALNYSPGTFANNSQPHLDIEGCDHDMFSFGLKKALYNYMHNKCLGHPIEEWFDFKLPKINIAPNMIKKLIKGTKESH